MIEVGNMVPTAKGEESLQREKVLLGNSCRTKRRLVELDALQTKKIKLSHLVTCEMTSSALQDRLEIKQV